MPIANNSALFLPPPPISRAATLLVRSIGSTSWATKAQTEAKPTAKLAQLLS